MEISKQARDAAEKIHQAFEEGRLFTSSCGGYRDEWNEELAEEIIQKAINKDLQKQN